LGQTAAYYSFSVTHLAALGILFWKTPDEQLKTRHKHIREFSHSIFPITSNNKQAKKSYSVSSCIRTI